VHRTSTKRYHFRATSTMHFNVRIRCIHSLTTQTHNSVVTQIHIKHNGAVWQPAISWLYSTKNDKPQLKQTGYT